MASTDSPSTLKDIGELLGGIASILWVSVPIILSFVFKDEIKLILRRIKGLKLFGQDLDLSEEVDKLGQEVAVSNKEERILLKPPEEKGDRSGSNDSTSVWRNSFTFFRDQFVESDDSIRPKLEIIYLSSQIEKELREIFFSQQIRRDTAERFTVNYALSVLRRRNSIKESTARAIESFWNIRNQVAHALSAPKHELVAAVEYGKELLTTLKEIPRGRYFINKIDISVYSDPDCLNQISDVTGIIIETRQLNENPFPVGIYPTTKRDYIEGNQVVWEWNEDNRWGTAWYHDPETGKVIRAWVDSFEFVGRMI